MSLEVPSGRGVFDPNYWEGFDLRNGQGQLPERKMWKLVFKNHNRLVPHLKSAIGEVVQGNHTEIRFGPGREFDPEAAGITDGSVVVMDSEELTAWPRITKDTSEQPPISEPYVGYWLDNQPSTPHTGFEMDYDPAGELTYSRWLTWGILTTTDVNYYPRDSERPMKYKKRVIQPISFSQVAYQDGKITVPKFTSLKPWHHTLVLPDVVGRAQITAYRYDMSTNQKTDEAASIERVRSIDLVHLAKSSKRRRLSPKLGRLTLPKTAGA